MNPKDIPQGIIELGTPAAEALGFTDEKFDGYLWRIEDEIYISLIISRQPQQGNMNRLFQTIEESGFSIAVPNPIGLMLRILSGKGFEPTWEDDGYGGKVAVWRKKK